ncbi:MAG: penicillin-binding protein 2 [Thermodesulfobacteriota bacterium]
MRLSLNPFSDETEDLRGRHAYLVVAVTAFFIILLLRLWHLQVIRGHDFKIQSESNRTRLQDILPARGLIMDRYGLVLAENRPSYDLAVIKEDLGDRKTLAARLAQLLGLSFEEVWSRFEAIQSKPSFEPAVLISGLNRENVVTIETHRYELPGTMIQVKPQRTYHYDQLASHLVGYMGEVNQDQLARAEYREHRMGDLAGQYGIEREWETYLHGKRGRRLVEVDASGRVLKIIETLDPSPGSNLYLTMDTRLQRICQEILTDKVGAIVALHPFTGEILAMATSPTFSQNDFAGGISSEKWRELLDNPLHPLENRAISGQYPPGSTFKIVTATAALEEGVVTPETIITCPGVYPFGDTVFHCWNTGGHGAVNMHRAIKESCDVYFYEVSRRLGIERLAKWSRAFGLGRKTDVGLTNEKGGVVPDREWKRQRFKTAWRPGETMPVAIGQGYNLVTPLQMAQVMAVAANGGVLYRSRLVRLIADTEGREVKYFQPEVVHNLNLKPQTVEVLRRGLAAVVNEPGGTGYRAKLNEVAVAGKTGTAQVVALKRYQGWSRKDLPYKYRDHAWFVAYAPADRPKIALAVLLEHGGGGGANAAPLAKQVLEAFFHPEMQSAPPPPAAADQAEPGD